MKSSRKSRKSIRYSIFIGILAGSVFSGSGAFAAVEINTQGDLEAIGINETTLDRDYILMSDLSLNPPTSGASTYITGTFTGTLAGNGKTLSGLTKPLFDVIGGQVSDLVLRTNTYGVSGNGALGNSTWLSTSIEDIEVIGTVNGTTSDVGGILGSLGGTMSGSTFTGNVNGTSNTGGLVGYSYGDISGSTFSGTVTGVEYVGGLVGLSSGDISLSSASGIVSSTSTNFAVDTGAGISLSISPETAGSYIGGLVGSSSGTITSSSASADVSSTATITTSNAGAGISLSQSSATAGSYIGGLVGSSTGTITSSSASGDVSSTATIATGDAGAGIDMISSSATAGSYIGGLVGSSTGTITSSSASGDVSSTATISLGSAGADIHLEYSSALGGSYVGGLVGSSTADITATFASGSVSSTATFSTGSAGSSIDFWYSSSSQSGSFLGGLVGSLTGNILNSHAYVNGDVTSMATVSLGEALEESPWPPTLAVGDLVGGLAGSVNGNISNSYAYVDGDVVGDGAIGGLVGSIEGNIYNSYSEVNGDVTGTDDYVGGLAGIAYSTISNSYADITGDVTGLHDRVGGLSGRSDGDISNSHAIVGGSVTGLEDVGGFVGFIGNGVDISNSYFQGNVADSYAEAGWFIGGFLNCGTCTVLDSFSTGNVSNEFLDAANVFGRSPHVLPTVSYSCAAEIIDGFLSCLVGGDAPRPLISNLGADGQLGEAFAVDEVINGGMPHLISLRENYLDSTSDEGDGESSPGRARLEREIREVVEAATPNKIEKAIGFKNETPLPKNAAIAFVDSQAKIDINKVKAVEITPSGNVKVSAKTGEALQISLKSESKESVELWVKSPDGTWLLAGVITFDKDGKAILPPLQFKSAGDYTLVLNKPSAGSAKGSAPLNQTGSLLVAVN